MFYDLEQGIVAQKWKDNDQSPLMLVGSTVITMLMGESWHANWVIRRVLKWGRGAIPKGVSRV